MTSSRPLHHVALLHAGSMTALLVILVAGIFVIPVVTPGGDTGRVVDDISLTLILISGAAAVAGRGTLSLAAAILCAIAIVVRWSEWLVPAGLSPFVHNGSALLALFVVLVIVAVRVFGADVTIVTADRVVGAIVLYLLLGVVWAAAYDLVAMHVAEAFSGVRPTGSGPQRWLYFSFVTLTTVGYGDIVPVAPAARSLAALEALVGQLYPAIILARLVSLQIK